MHEASSFDVAVVGAGPAGLSAAIRVRWVKSHGGVPCSVAVFDPAELGGLARLRSTRLTGPSFHLQGKRLIGRLEQDIRHFHIPVVAKTITALRWVDQRWQLWSGAELLATARAVILATGLRRLSNELDYFGKGVTLTYNGYDYLATILQQSFSKQQVQHFTIIGHEKTRNLLPVIESIVPKDTELSFLLDTSPHLIDWPQTRGPFYFGQVHQFQGASRLQSIEYVNAEGELQQLPCDLSLIDYMAFELRPERFIEIDHLEYDSDTFIKIDREGKTNLPGLFAAGDMTGLYAMVTKSLSEGVIAGFSAYRYVFEQKFGEAPLLFAYAATDHILDPQQLDYPKWHSEDHIQVLMPLPAEGSQVLKGFSEKFTPFDSGICVNELEAQYGIEAANRLILLLLDGKYISFFK